MIIDKLIKDKSMEGVLENVKSMDQDMQHRVLSILVGEFKNQIIKIHKTVGYDVDVSIEINYKKDEIKGGLC